MSRVSTTPKRIPNDIADEVEAIVALYREQPLSRPEIKRRLALLTDEEHYTDPTGAETLARLASIDSKLDDIAKDAAAAATKGTRPSKPRTTRKSDA